MYAILSYYENSGFRPPHQCGRITVNLAPADLPKASSMYDLPIALGFLLATKQIQFDSANKLIVGELALDGKIRSVQGILPLALLAKAKNISQIYVPLQNASEASIVEGIEIIVITSYSIHYTKLYEF